MRGSVYQLPHLPHYWEIQLEPPDSYFAPGSAQLNEEASFEVQPDGHRVKESRFQYTGET